MALSDTFSAQGRNSTSLQMDLFALALTPLLVIIQGHRFGVGNQDFLISFLRRLANPDWLSGDWMMGTPVPHPQLLVIVSPICQLLGEPTTFLLLHLATRALLLMGIWRLVLELLPGRNYTAVSAMVFTLAEPRLRVGSHYLQGGNWEPAFLGMAFSVWILALGCRILRKDSGVATKDYFQLGLFAGGGLYSHLFIAGPVMAIVFATLFFSSLRKWQFWASLLVVLFLGAPSWIYALKGFFFPPSGGLSGVEVIRVLQFRHPHHHQPWTWPVTHWFQWSAILISTVIGWWRVKAEPGKCLWILMGFMLWFVFSCIAFVLLGRWESIPLVAYLQPFRLFPLLWLFHLVLVIELLRSLEPRLPRLIYWSFLPLAFLMLRFVGLWGPLAMALLILFWRQQSKHQTTNDFHPTLQTSLSIMFFSFMILIGLQLLSPFRDAVNTIKREHWLAELKPADSDRAELVHWIQRNTTTNDMFAIPPAMANFRIWEERPILVDLKNVPFRALELQEWSTRIGAVYQINPLLSFQTPPTTDPTIEQITSFGQLYNAKYAVLRESYSGENILFSNSSYTVIDLTK